MLLKLTTFIEFFWDVRRRFNCWREENYSPENVGNLQTESNWTISRTQEGSISSRSETLQAGYPGSFITFGRRCDPGSPGWCECTKKTVASEDAVRRWWNRVTGCWDQRTGGGRWWKGKSRWGDPRSLTEVDALQRHTQSWRFLLWVLFLRPAKRNTMFGGTCIVNLKEFRLSSAFFVGW